MHKKGKVYLIGAGPGDPGLITVKGLKCLGEADVVIYDYLVSPELLRHTRKDSRLLYVGKKGGDHSISQPEINRMIVEEAKKGAIVARLKGGDPFIFGRGGEEAEVIAAERHRIRGCAGRDLGHSGARLRGHPDDPSRLHLDPVLRDGP